MERIEAEMIDFEKLLQTKIDNTDMAQLKDKLEVDNEISHTMHDFPEFIMFEQIISTLSTMQEIGRLSAQLDEVDSGYERLHPCKSFFSILNKKHFSNEILGVNVE